MYPPELARLLEKATRLDWEGVPDPFREAVRDLDTDTLKGRNLQLALLIANDDQSRLLERLSRALSEELRTRSP